MGRFIAFLYGLASYAVFFVTFSRRRIRHLLKLPDTLSRPGLRGKGLSLHLVPGIRVE
jgi:hypothetical protein